MPEFPMNFISMPLAFFLSFGVVLALTPLVKIFSAKHGFVAQPAGTRWHKEPTPLMGGIAIFIGIVVGLGADGGNSEKLEDL